jgi:hypothetical protein
MAESHNSSEIWKPVVGYEGFYEVSDLGAVRSVDRNVEANYSGRVRLKRKVGVKLAPFPDKDGYLQVKLCGVGRPRSESIHRIVCRAFHGPKPTPEHEVSHRDGTRTNNREENLRWATDKENQADRVRHGTAMVGENAPMARLTRPQAAEIKRRSNEGEWSSIIAAEFGINKRYVREIATGKAWASLE